MKSYRNPSRSEWPQLGQRPTLKQAELTPLLQTIFTEVKTKGDEAVQKYTALFDGVEAVQTRVSETELAVAEQQVSPDLKNSIQLAIKNITAFHSSQEEKPQPIETTEGVVCWRESRPIEKVGLYIPGGSAPLFSTVLMLGIPAKLAGCQEIVLCTPPKSDGSVDAAILYAAQQIGIKTICKVGGIQAIAAMTFGTATFPAVYKIFGPGNQYVTAAKQEALKYGVAIDMPAGPSEVLVIADEKANPKFVAADLLSQAEHGPDSQVILATSSAAILAEVKQNLEQQLNALPRKAIAAKALLKSKLISFETLESCVAFSNYYAPEHLILAVDNPEELVSSIQNAGSVFLGKYSCESAGDYASGTNHTLPTNGAARAYSGVSLDSFIKKITFQKLSAQGVQQIGKAVETMAAAEGLVAHQKAMQFRRQSILEKA